MAIAPVTVGTTLELVYDAAVSGPFPGNVQIESASGSTLNASQASLTLNTKPAWAKYVRMTVDFESDSSMVFDYDLSKSGTSQGDSAQRSQGSQNDVNEILVTLTNVADPVLTIDSVGYYERDNFTWASLSGLAAVVISNIRYVG